MASVTLGPWSGGGSRQIRLNLSISNVDSQTARVGVSVEILNDSTWYDTEINVQIHDPNNGWTSILATGRQTWDSGHWATRAGGSWSWADNYTRAAYDNGVTESGGYRRVTVAIQAVAYQGWGSAQSSSVVELIIPSDIVYQYYPGYGNNAELTSKRQWRGNSNNSWTVANSSGVTRPPVTTTGGGYTVSFNLNGGTSTKPSNKTSDKTTSYTFNGWKNYRGYNASTNDKLYSSGQSTYWNLNDFIWVRNSSGWLNTDNGNAWTFGHFQLKALWKESYTYSKITLPAAPTRPGYTFNGWYTAASGGTKAGDAGASYTPSSNQTLYAQWTAKSQTVTFNANGGTTPTASKTVTYDQTYGALPIPTRPGYEFLGWFTSLDGGMEVTSDTVVKITAAQTLYAHWKVMGAVFAHDGDQWQRALCYLSTDDGWKHALPYVYTSDGWKLTIF